jgi:hypothetical protein
MRIICELDVSLLESITLGRYNPAPVEEQPEQ